MSLKDALLKAGLSSSKNENSRSKKLVKEKNKTEKHQEHRNFCEVCDTTQPDVERFKHKMPTVDAEWICSNCADKNEIHDKFRVTNQSEFSTSGRYRRYYGPTIDPEGDNFFKKNNPYKNRKKTQDETQTKAREARYTVDDDGEKNFNC